MTKKKFSAGAVVACFSAVLAIVGLISYIINTGTNYYASIGVNSGIIVCLAVAAALSVVRLFFGRDGQPAWTDLFPVCGSVLTTLAFMFLINARVNSLAAVFTFENNAANMADTTSCIVAIAACLLAVIFTIVSAFMDTVKEA